jgi:hypothetical protein
MDSTNFYYQQLTHAQILVKEPHIAEANKPQVQEAANTYVIYAHTRGHSYLTALLVIRAFTLPEVP